MSGGEKIKPAIKKTKAAAAVNKAHRFSLESKMESPNVPDNYPLRETKDAIRRYLVNVNLPNQKIRELLRNFGDELLRRNNHDSARTYLISPFMMNHLILDAFPNPTDRVEFFEGVLSGRNETIEALLAYVPSLSTDSTEEERQAFLKAVRQVREEHYPRTSPGNSLQSNEIGGIPNPQGDANRPLVPRAVVIGPQMQPNLIELLAREENAVQANPDEISKPDGGESEQVTNRAPQANPLRDDLSSIGLAMSEETGDERVGNAQEDH